MPEVFGLGLGIVIGIMPGVLGIIGFFWMAQEH